MKSVRIRVELNKGRIGIPLSKLASITEETKKFLSLVAKDADIERDSKDWLALKFENHSLYYDCVLDDVDDDKAETAKIIMRQVMSSDRSTNLVSRIHPKTRFQFAKIADSIDEDEIIGFGIYSDGEEPPEFHYDLSRRKASDIIADIDRYCVYGGEIQGYVHAFYKEVKKPKMVVRELSSGNLVDCFFKPELYEAAVETLTEKDGIIFVEGEVRENLIDETIESIDASDFRPAPFFDEIFFKSFIGSVPNLTGSHTSEEALTEDE